MRLHLAVLASSLAFSAGAPAVASPQADAAYIARRFVGDEEFQSTLRDMMQKAHAEALAHVLSARSVKVRNHDKFMALLPETAIDPVGERLQGAVADILLQAWEPAQIASAADHLRQSPLELNLNRSAAEADAVVRTLQEVVEEAENILKSDAFKTETALSNVGVTLIFLVVQEGRRIDIDLEAPYVADLLEVDGVFEFPNRIVRNDLIRALRPPSP